jgi:hypothetical protein
MKPELLEYLVRTCTREVLKQVNEDKEGYFFRVKGRPAPILSRAFVNEEEETKGAPAPPADGQGTADQPAVPKNEPQTLNDPKADADAAAAKKPEPKPKQVKGINIVNPRDKSKLQQVALKSKDDASIERELHRLGSSLAGSKVKVAISTMRAVKSANPNTPLFLYIGKYDPQSDELFVLADNSLQVAKDSSAEPESLTAAQPDYTAPVPFNPTMATANDFGQRMANAGQTVPQPIDETIHKLVKQMVNSILDSK